MATIAGDSAYQERALFVRKATGLVRGWSVWDGFVYAAFSINLITLGLFIFSYAPFIPSGSLLWAVVLSGFYLVLQGVTYASLIAAMPRAGGDYVWISRTLGGGLGFVLAACGWWFILWHWVPIYANILNVEVLEPLFSIAGWQTGASWMAGKGGMFASSMVVAAAASVLVSLGMRTYARFQKFCFYGGLVGLAMMIVVMLIWSKGHFIGNFNHAAHQLYGTTGNAYAATNKAGAYGAPHIASFAVKGTFLLFPMIAFFNLWSNWGATLYGEVRGASDFRKNIMAMGGALIATTIAAAVLLGLFGKAFGWDFYNNANNAYWGQIYAYVKHAPIAYFPYPGLLAGILTGSRVFEFILVAILSLWFWGWVGTVFLSSTRVVFASAFDRVLPEAAAKVTRGGVPWVALLLMLVPSIPVSYFYAYNGQFATWTLDATLVIAITFTGSAIAAAIFPWRRPDIYNASPIARYRILGLPIITAAALAFLAFLAFCLFEWFKDSAYGINNHSSLWYMGALYLLAIVIYAASWLYRRSQGLNLGMVYGEIPAE